MGTSRSKPDAPSRSPLVPPWAENDPPPPASPGGATKPQKVEPPKTEVSPEGLAPSGRYKAFRASLGRFASSGSRDDARTALGHWVAISAGGARALNRRLSRAKDAGGAVLAGLARAQANQPPVANALDIRALAGQPMETAISQIVDAFCPSGILDEEVARLAIGEALANALAGADTFDPTAINTNAVRLAMLRFVAELVFVSVMGDGKECLSKAPTPAAAVQRELDIRAIIREVTDAVGTPLINAAADAVTPGAMTSLVSRLVQVVLSEIQSWQ